LGLNNTKLFGKDRGHELQFRGEMSQRAQSDQFAASNLTLTDISAANSPRNMQIMLRYQF